MNTARLVLDSLEKNASSGLVMAAVEAATGAAIGGTLGLAHARTGRSSSPVGSSDISGAAYGALMGALAGAGAGTILRDAATHRGIKANQRLKSMAESVINVENAASISKANLDNWNSVQVRDLLYSQSHPGQTYSGVEQQLQQVRERIKQQTATKNQLKERVHAMNKANTPDNSAQQQLSDLISQLQDSKLVTSGMSQRLKEIRGLEKADLKSAQSVASNAQEVLKQQKDALDAYRSIVEKQERAKANSRFMGMF